MTTPAAFAPALAAWPATTSREAAATFAIAARSSRRAISPTLIDIFSSSWFLPFPSWPMLEPPHREGRKVEKRFAQINHILRLDRLLLWNSGEERGVTP